MFEVEVLLGVVLMLMFVCLEGVAVGGVLTSVEGVDFGVSS